MDDDETEGMTAAEVEAMEEAMAAEFAARLRDAVRGRGCTHQRLYRCSRCRRTGRPGPKPPAATWGDAEGR